MNEKNVPPIAETKEYFISLSLLSLLDTIFSVSSIKLISQVSPKYPYLQKHLLFLQNPLKEQLF